MPVTTDSPAPYAPAATIMEVITRFRDRGMQTPFTRDVLERAGVTESLINRTLQSLQALDLMDGDGNPTDVLQGFATAGRDELPARMAEWLRATYAEVFNYVDPAKDDAERIRDAFRSYEPRGQQGRMVTLFLGLCARAGIRQASEDGAQRPRGTQRRRNQTPASQRRQDAGSGSRRKSAVHDAGLPQPIVGLLAELPESRKWTKERRDAFVNTFQAVLDFCVKVVDEEDSDEEGL